MKPFTSKHCTPINYGSPLEQKGFTKTLTDKEKERDPNVSTRTYNAATGLTTEQDPTYNYDKRHIYNANAIETYGSLENARKASRDKVNKFMKKYNKYK